MQFRPWRLITAAIQQRFREIQPRNSRDSGRYSCDTATIPDVHQFLRWSILSGKAAISATNFAQPALCEDAARVLRSLNDIAGDNIGNEAILSIPMFDVVIGDDDDEHRVDYL